MTTTYSSLSSNVRTVVRELRGLYRIRTQDMRGDVAASLAHLRNVERSAVALGGSEHRGLDVLVVGCGQTPRELIGFGAQNRVIGIDLDVVPSGFAPRAYLQLLRENGPVRVAKTLGRKVLGIDRKFNAEMRRQLGTTVVSSPTILQMDAGKMTFPDDSFDVAYSYSVFEHLPEPAVVLAEMVRVLRPGGTGFVSSHFWTSESGAHDIRVFAGDREQISFWAHLRPAHRHETNENAFLNYWRVEQYRELYASITDGHIEVEFHEPTRLAVLTTELAKLRASGELSGYTDEELLGVNISVMWRKPLSASPPIVGRGSVL